MPAKPREDSEWPFFAKTMEVTMQRRHFIFKTAAAFAATGLGLSGCGTTTSANVTSASSPPSGTRRRADLDSNVDAALSRLYSAVSGSRELVQKANGVLVFPNVVSAGLVIGGQFGEGQLRVRNRADGYYSLASLSAGLQAGAQSKAIYLLFMTPETLNKFRESESWSIGVDAQAALIKVGANGEIDLNTVKGPVTAFVLTNAGLMAGVTLEGTKITKLQS
jgi:lipid-binding SYLF domain-containing protein